MTRKGKGQARCDVKPSPARELWLNLAGGPGDSLGAPQGQGGWSIYTVLPTNQWSRAGPEGTKFLGSSGFSHAQPSRTHSLSLAAGRESPWDLVCTQMLRSSRYRQSALRGCATTFLQRIPSRK